MENNYPTQKVLEVAKKQRNLILVFLLYFLCAGAVAAISDPELVSMIRVVGFLFALALVVFLGLLAFTIFSTPMAVLLTLLCLVPLLNLISFLVVNSKANKVIKSAGYRVGLAGADIKAIENDI